MSQIKTHIFDTAVNEPVLHTKRKIKPKFVVMHYTAGFSARSAIDAYKARKVSAHLTLDTDGTLYQHVPFNVEAWHAGPSQHMGYSSLNKHSIGIEIVNAGWFRKSGSNYVRDRIVKPESEMPPMEPYAHSRVGSGTFWWPSYSDKQLEVLDNITEEIVAQYNILDITSHEQIDTRGWKTDPGPAFPIERYKRLLMTTQNNRSLDSDKYEVAASRLNVRSGPGTSFSVIDSVSRGQMVKVIDMRNDWARVDINGNDDGWVSEAFIRRA